MNPSQPNSSTDQTANFFWLLILLTIGVLVFWWLERRYIVAFIFSVRHYEIELIKGDATQTIPEYVAKNPHLIISLLYLDFDIYEPTKTALEYLLPLVPKGGIVGLDEINCKSNTSELKLLPRQVSTATVL